jgi:MFS family permease
VRPSLTLDPGAGRSHPVPAVVVVHGDAERPRIATRTPREAYVSLGITFVTLALTYGVWYAYSVFLVAFLREFEWSRSVLAGAFSVFMLAHGAWNTVAGWLTDRIGPRRVMTAGGVVLALGLVADSLVAQPWHLYVVFGLLTAIGVSSAGWTPAVVMVQRQFDARLGLALGIAGSGIGAGIFLVVPLCQALIDAVGWRWAFRVLAIVCVAWIVPATTLFVRDPARGARASTSPRRPVTSPVVATVAAVPEVTLRTALVTLPFWLIIGAKFLSNASSQTLLVHQAAYLVDHGITPIMAASVISVVGVASIVGKTGGGWLSDHVDREVVYVLGMALLLASIAMLGGLALVPSTWTAYGYAVLIGLGYAVTASLIPAILGDRFRGPHFGAIFGVAQVGSSLGGALGAWLAGRIFDVTGSYAIALGVAAATAFAAGVAVWTARSVRIATRAASAGRRGEMTPMPDRTSALRPIPPARR